MTALPSSASFVDSAVTEAEFKTAITNQRNYLSGLFGDDGVNANALTTLGAAMADTVAKSANYTVVDTDRGKIILCTGTFTLTLTAAATLGDGFNFSVINIGSGTITIDPNSTEQIDGASTKTLEANSWAIVACNGTAFYSMGAIPVSGTLLGYQVFTSSGTYTKATNNPSFVIVEVQGGGGSGGAGATGSGLPPVPTYYGGGGGGGGYSLKKLLASALTSSETVTVGGVAGTSSFGSHCSATGGATGSAASSFNDGVNGAGGSGSSGDINRSGQGGLNASGGSSPNGFGGNSVSRNGISYGGGAAGGLGVSYSAGTGTSGIVIVWEYK